MNEPTGRHARPRHLTTEQKARVEQSPELQELIRGWADARHHCSPPKNYRAECCYKYRDLTREDHRHMRVVVTCNANDV